MNSQTNPNAIFAEIQQLLAEEKVFLRNCICKIETLEAKNSSLKAGTSFDDNSTSHISRLKQVAVATNHILSEKKISSIKEDDFDLVLDMAEQSLKFRKDPAKHTPLKKSKLKGVGSHRIKILAYMLKHPTRHISAENIYKFYDANEEIREPNTLAKTISLLRKALEQKGSDGPYILTKPAWSESRRKNSGVYVLDPRWKYLVIKEYG